MSWRERLEPASFKGVPFWVDSHTVTKPRRTTVRRLVGRDGAVIQDLGRDADEHTVTAFVFGEDYDLARDKLEDALTESGAGALILPTRGEIWARITQGPETSEQRSEGGYCTIRFRFVKDEHDAGALSSLGSQVLHGFPDTSANLTDAATKLTAAAAADFVETFDASSLPEKYLNAARDAVGKATETLRFAQRQISGAVALVDNVTGAITELDNAVNTIMATPSLLVTTLIGLVRGVIGLADTFAANIDRTTGLAGLLEDPYARSVSVRITGAVGVRFAGLGSDATEGGDSDLSRRAADNARAVYRVTRASALARQAETYAVAPFDSSTLALAMLDGLSKEVDALSLYGPNDALFAALADTRAAAAAHLLQTASKLPETIEYTPKRALPALLIAHDLYADARQDAEIIARNGIPHPLFVSGPLEVIAP